MKNTTVLSARLAELQAEEAKIKAELAELNAKTVEKSAKVSHAMRLKIVAAIEADGNATGPTPNKYRFPCYMASKVFYAAKATSGKIDPDLMSDNTARVIGLAYGFKL